MWSNSDFLYSCDVIVSKPRKESIECILRGGSCYIMGLSPNFNPTTHLHTFTPTHPHVCVCEMCGEIGCRTPHIKLSRSSKWSHAQYIFINPKDSEKDWYTMFGGKILLQSDLFWYNCIMLIYLIIFITSYILFY